MKLAIFTPGAYVWPVHRSFEGFVASLGTVNDSADSLWRSQLYPVDSRIKQGTASLDGRHGERLQRLHREIYDALLRPSETYSGSTNSIESEFWPDLAGTPPAQLLQALMFFFLRTGIAGVTISKGLAVFRSLFFNHESAEPEHWLHSAIRRTSAECSKHENLDITYDAPAVARINDLAFTLMASQASAPVSSGMVSGRIQRNGPRLVVNAQIGLDPTIPVDDREKLEQLRAEVKGNINQVFGWASEAAA